MTPMSISIIFERGGRELGVWRGDAEADWDSGGVWPGFTPPPSSRS